MEQEVEKFTFEEGARELVHLQNLPSDEQVRRSGANSGAHTIRDQVTTWSVEEVCSWLKNLQLTEYNDHFVSHDIRGRELLSLTGEDLEKIGITKVGHVKRILQAINDLNN